MARTKYCVMYAPFSREIRAGRMVRCTADGYGEMSDSHTDVTAQAVWAVISLMRANLEQGDSLILDGWMLTLKRVPEYEGVGE